MTRLAIQAMGRPARPAVAEALDRQFEPEALAALLGLPPTLVPARLWEACLLGPARSFLERPGKQFRAALVESAFALGGGQGTAPTLLPLLVEMVHAGSLIVDDIEDGSVERRGAPALHREVGLPLALNTGNWLYFWPLALIDGFGFPIAVARELHARFAKAMLRCHQGQALDLSVRLGSVSASELPGVVLAVSRLKTGSLMELAASVGAVAAGAPAQRAEAIARFGATLGLALQMLDDLGSVGGRKDPAKRLEDLRNGRVTWVWAWLARVVDPFTFAALVQRANGVAGRSGAAVDAAAAELADELQSAVGETGLREVRGLLARAFADLRAATADVPGAGRVLAGIQGEIDRLERSYG